jgi:hypothetical protein
MVIGYPVMQAQSRVASPNGLRRSPPSIGSATTIDRHYISKADALGFSLKTKYLFRIELCSGKTLSTIWNKLIRSLQIGGH